MTTRYERMHEGMHKIHGGDGTVWHIFNALDHGDPHDHPWSFTSEVMFGGYDELVFDRTTGAETLIHRREGDIFHVPADHIHRIIRFHGWSCITRIRPGPPVQKSGFWRWDEHGPLHRFWDDPEFSRWEAVA